MTENWNKFINEILSNTDNGSTRKVAPIGKDDMKNIVLLDATDASILWNIYFSDTVKYALLFEHTYGEPIMTSIFDESETDPDNLPDTYRGILRSMHSDETPILIYWSSCIAIETTWGMFIKYWNNFFYYPEDTIIYVNQREVYFYNEMKLKKMCESKLKSISGDSIFSCLEKFKDDKEKKAKTLDSLFEGIPRDMQFELYSLYQELSEGFRAIGKDENCKQYINYCRGALSATNLIITGKSYSKESLQYLKTTNYLDNSKRQFNESVGKFYEMLKKIVDEKLSK